MSTNTGINKSSSSRNIKRIGVEHTAEIRALCDQNPTHNALFGDDLDIEETICKSLMTLGADDYDQLVAVLSVTAYPNLAAIAPWDWDQWFHNIYTLESIKARNTVWVSLLAYDQNHLVILEQLLNYLFEQLYYLEFTILFVPIGLERLEFMEKLAYRVTPRDEQESNQSIYVMTRQRFLYSYQVRRAVQEDNDEIVSLIEMHSKKLRKLYGDFYIAEILGDRRYKNREVIVAIHQNSPVAVLITNKTVNYETLQKEFELEPYHGFKKRNLVAEACLTE